MVTNLGMIGYHAMEIPGFKVDKLLGKGAFSVVLKANPIPGDEDIPKTEDITEQLPASFSILRVPGDGNCLFHAIADQLQRQQIRNATDGEVYTHETLRTMALSLINVEPRFRQMMSDHDYFDLSRLNGFVDIWSIAALARALEMNIVIYGAPGGLPVRIDAHGNFDREVVGLPVLRIAYNGYNHYDSVVTSATSSFQYDINQYDEDTSWKKRLRPRQEETPYPNKRAKTEQKLACVAIKIFQEKHKQMRDHEVAILRRLVPNFNVPYVVRSCDLQQGPAVIVGPVGNMVLPVKNGVRTFTADYLKLLQVLEDAHRQGICHRDVKPENIFKDDHGCIILSDWSSSAQIGKIVDWA